MVACVEVGAITQRRIRLREGPDGEVHEGTGRLRGGNCYCGIALRSRRVGAYFVERNGRIGELRIEPNIVCQMI